MSLVWDEVKERCSKSSCNDGAFGDTGPFVEWGTSTKEADSSEWASYEISDIHKLKTHLCLIIIDSHIDRVPAF